jgi:hypothetical protein
MIFLEFLKIIKGVWEKKINKIFFVKKSIKTCLQIYPNEQKVIFFLCKIVLNQTQH